METSNEHQEQIETQLPKKEIINTQVVELKIENKKVQIDEANLNLLKKFRLEYKETRSSIAFAKAFLNAMDCLLVEDYALVEKFKELYSKLSKIDAISRDTFIDRKSQVDLMIRPYYAEMSYVIEYVVKNGNSDEDDDNDID